MNATTHTARMFHATWDFAPFRIELLTVLRLLVSQGASRRDIDMFLKKLPEEIPLLQTALIVYEISPEEVHWEHLTNFFCSYLHAERERGPYPDIPSDEIWEQSFQLTPSHTPAASRDAPVRDEVPPEFAPLKARLLELGGHRVVYRGREYDLDNILTRGEVFDGISHLRKGERSRCHHNAAAMWAQQKDQLAIVTGYALSEDGLWRQHTWLVRKHPKPRERRVIETTARRVLYFGFILTDLEAEAFYEANG